jgi:ADP-heptose:LPS heptosyltransferase
VNEFLISRPGVIARLAMTLTVVDVFGTPGDTLLTAIVCRELKRNHPRLKLNCRTPNPTLLELDPNIDSVNARDTFCSIPFTYLGLIRRKDSMTNVLKPTMDKLGIAEFEYKATVFLSSDEMKTAAERLQDLARPIITINVASRERVKMWSPTYWPVAVKGLQQLGTVVQIGDDREPVYDGVARFAGELSMRESMAVLAHSDLHIGPDSFLMHAANGVGVSAIVIYGGSRPSASLGYSDNTNISSEIDCAPCWIHDSHGEHCPYNIKCMDMITPDQVIRAAEEILGGRNTNIGC